jgi:hypothetical protein
MPLCFSGDFWDDGDVTDFIDWDICFCAFSIILVFLFFVDLNFQVK